MIELRKPKGRGGFGMARDPAFPAKGLTPGGPLRKHGKTKRATEQNVFKLLRALIIQEVSDVTGVARQVLGKWELDHIHGRNAPNFEPIGSMLSPLNLQLLHKSVHAEKTNALNKEGQRMDYRTTAVQERMVDLTARLLKKTGEPFNLGEYKKAINSEIYYE